jgi:uncharacterized membrane protein YcaP (DUF421 family)
MHTVLYATVGYFFLLVAVRVLSRRPGAQMTPFEFVLVFLMGGVIILSTVGDDHSVTNAVCGVLTVGLWHRTVSTLKIRFPRLGAIVDGTPLVVLERDQWHTEVMQKMRLADDDVMAAARVKGVKTLDQIKYAVLERNGAISVIKKQQK